MPAHLPLGLLPGLPLTLVSAVLLRLQPSVALSDWVAYLWPPA